MLKDFFLDLDVILCCYKGKSLEYLKGSELSLIRFEFEKRSQIDLLTLFLVQTLLELVQLSLFFFKKWHFLILREEMIDFVVRPVFASIASIESHLGEQTGSSQYIAESLCKDHKRDNDS